MLSLYDALTFSVQKKSLMGSVVLGIVMLACFVATGFIMEKNFLIFSALTNSMGSSASDVSKMGMLAQIVLSLKQISFWQTLYPKAIWITVLFLVCSFVFFGQTLILAKKKLFKLSDDFSIPFLLTTLIKILILLVPIAAIAYFYMHNVLFSVFQFGMKNVALNTKTGYVHPFSTQRTIGCTIAAVCYLYYTFCLFPERFSFLSLLKPTHFFKHLKTVFEAFWLHIVSIGMLVCGWCCVILLNMHITSTGICFAIAFAYLLLVGIGKNVRVILLIPLCFAILTIAVGTGVMHNQSWAQQWPLSLAGLLLGSIYFVFWFMTLSVLAHIFAQVAYVAHFNKTPSSDIKATAADKLRRMEDIYGEYLEEHHVEDQDNFFDHLK